MFLSSYENKLDKKGRVSVPSRFRAYLNSMGYNGFITYPSFNNAALEACAQDRIESLILQRPWFELWILVHVWIILSSNDNWQIMSNNQHAV